MNVSDVMATNVVSTEQVRLDHEMHEYKKCYGNQCSENMARILGLTMRDYWYPCG